MDFQAKTMSGAMHECVPQAVRREHLAGCGIDQARLQTRPNRGNCRAMGRPNGCKRAQERVGCR
jgi:hypothetical protein